jgi:predicted lipid-binding transport protein (Tim44 family)
MTPAAGVTDPVPGIGGAPAAEPEPVVAERRVPKAFVPATFDSESFARTAKMIFIRMQAANDAADLDDLRRFTTPEFFASVRLDLQERGAAENHTDVQRVDAEVLDVTNEADQQIVSVRFRGDIVEERGGHPQAFDEVWHLVKPHAEGGQWAIAGIEQMN